MKTHKELEVQRKKEAHARRLRSKLRRQVRQVADHTHDKRLRHTQRQQQVVTKATGSGTKVFRPLNSAGKPNKEVRHETR